MRRSIVGASCKSRGASILAISIVLAGALSATSGAPSAGAAGRLKVFVSVPSALAANSRHMWLANTGTSSVLEFVTKTGAEVRNVTGTHFQLDESDSIATDGAAVWVANESSNTVTEFRASSGRLMRVLGAPKYRLEVPVAIAIASRHVFVLNQHGTRILELSESTGKLLHVLDGPRFHFVHTAGLAVVRNEIWTANGGGKGSLTEFNAATLKLMRVISASKGRLDTPVGITTDGLHLWVANRVGNHLSELMAVSGAFVRDLRVTRASVDAVTSIAVANHVVWVARAGHKTLVVGVNSTTGRTVRCSAQKFGFPAVFSDGQHIWVVDRTESRLSEVLAMNGHVLRVISS